MRTKTKPDTPAPPTQQRPERSEKRTAVFPLQHLKLEESPDPETGKHRIQGYASVFGVRDSYGDIVVKGAFERTLRERPDVKVLWQHNTRQPIGKQLEGHEDDYGLVVTGELSNTDHVTGEVMPLLKDGVITGLSIGFNVVEEEYVEDIRSWLLKDIDLWEWSPVTFPANELATIQDVKSLQPDRAARHAQTVERHAKALLNELDGYFKEGRHVDALPSGALSDLRASLARAAPGPDPVSMTETERQLAYATGARDALAGKLDIK
jgi:HK97 family phage prohead protease